MCMLCGYTQLTDQAVHVHVVCGYTQLNVHVVCGYTQLTDKAVHVHVVWVHTANRPSSACACTNHHINEQLTNKVNLNTAQKETC